MELNARAALYHAETRRMAMAALIVQADVIDANIKEVDDKMAKGFWECECGTEDFDLPPVPQDSGKGLSCGHCRKEMKLVRTDLLTGQEKYEAEKERGEAQKMSAANRQAAEHEAKIKENEQTAKQFQDQAKRTRDFADILRKL